MSLNNLPSPSKQSILFPSMSPNFHWGCAIVSTHNVISTILLDQFTVHEVKNWFLEFASITELRVEGISVDLIQKVLKELGLFSKLVSIASNQIKKRSSKINYPCIAISDGHSFVLHGYDSKNEEYLIMEPDDDEHDYEWICFDELSPQWISEEDGRYYLLEIHIRSE